MNKIFFLLGIICVGCTVQNNKSLTIATAANVQFAMEEIARSFKEESGVTCEIILGSSGQLNTQIKSGAPYDIFVSANMKYPQDIFESDLGLDEPAIYAHGVLVLWSLHSIVSLDDLVSDSVRRIALANPTVAPYGEAALEVLKKLNFLDRLNNKLVYGESISQVNHFILSKAVEAGFTSQSVVVSPELKNKGSWLEIDQSLYQPIEQGIVILKGDHEREARLFFDFLFSEKAKGILRRNGYRVN